MAKLKWGTYLGLVALIVSASAAVEAAPPGDRLVDQVQRAYGETNQYQAKQTLRIRQVEGRWTTTRSAEMTLAFDRERERLRYVRPDMTLTVTDGRLYLTSDDIPGRHLDTEAPSPLTYEALVELLPPLSGLTSPDLVFLLSDDPVTALVDGEQAEVETQAPAADDAAKRQRLQIIDPASNPPMAMTLAISDDRQLVASAVMDVDMQAVGMAAGDSFAMHFDFELEKHNQPIDEDVFAFDPPAGSTAVATLQEMVQQQAGGQGGGGEHPLVGQDAPAVELAMMDGGAFSLDEAEAEVIVLDFWATWCPPCREGLRKLQSVYEWIDEGDRSAAIYAVNLQETVEEARAYWAREGLTMPVLMDENGAIGAAYQARAIPQTVVIHNGKVAHVHVGATPDLDEQLKREIEALLGE